MSQKASVLRDVERMILNGSPTVPEISVAIGISESTVRRMIKELREMGSNATFEHGVGWHATRRVFAMYKRQVNKDANSTGSDSIEAKGDQ